MRFCLGCFGTFFFCLSLYAGEISNKEAQTCSSRLQRLAKKTFIIGTIGTSVLLAPAVYHDLNAQTQSVEHIGHGIYLDWEFIRMNLPENVLAWLKDPQTYQYELSLFFSEELQGDYQKQFQLLPRARLASSYLDFCAPESEERGVCRMKALVLHKILERIGIRSQLQIQVSKNFVGGHIWVYLPDLNMVADPTSGEVLPAETYYGTSFGERDPHNFVRDLFSLNDWKLSIFEYAWFR